LEKNNFFKKLIFLVTVFGVITVSSIGVIALSSGSMSNTAGEGGIVCSFYPVYDVVSALTEGTGKTVSNMTTGLTGCIHDYQVTTKDMKLLSEADLFVANGMDMEHFLENIAENREGLEIVYITDVFHEAYEINHSEEEEHDHEEESEGHHHHHADGVNPHVWTNPHNVREEAVYMADLLSERYPESSNVINSNLSAYLADVDEATKAYDELATYISECSGSGVFSEEVHAIAFNEAFEPLAEGLGIELIAVFSLDEDELPSAGEVAQAIEEAKKHGYVLVLIEEALKENADKVLSETEAVEVFTDPLTSYESSQGLARGTVKNVMAIREAIENAWVNK